MSQFKELLAQLSAVEEEQSTLAKSIPAEGSDDDQAIQAAAAEGGEANPEDDDELDAEGKPLAKSLNVDGEEVQLIDAEELIKSLDGLNARVGEQEEVLAKGLSSALKLIQSQGVMIKSLQAQVHTIGSQGAGRKAAVSLHEKAQAIEPLLAKSDAGNMTKEEFLGKSEAAWKAGKLSGAEFTEVDVSLRQGHAPSQALINKIIS